MKENFDINKELKEIAPFLSQLKKEEGYQVPFNYFEGLPDQILKQVESENRASTPKETNRSTSILDWFASLFQPQYALALATLVGALMIGVYFFSESSDLMNSSEMLVDISADDARLYVQENLDEFALELLAEDANVEFDYNSIFDLNESELEKYIEDEVLEDLDDIDLL